MIMTEGLTRNASSLVRKIIGGVNLAVENMSTIAKLLTCLKVQWLYF